MPFNYIKMKKNVFTLIFIITFLHIEAQELTYPEPDMLRYNMGFGVGLDYGGFGGRFTVLTSESFEFFGGFGYNLLGLGFNGGADIRILPQRRICPYVGGMYGYNAVIKINGADQYNQTYYGPSLNVGIEFWSLRNPGYFNFEVLLPFRSTEYHRDIRDLKNKQNIEFSSEPTMIGMSIGYHIAF
jgi:hypothetical protein